MSEKEKPDGYIAWHPRSGTLRIHNTKQVATNIGDAWYWLCDEKGSVVEDSLETSGPQIRITSTDFKRRMKLKGWRIRPVKLVFLDEDK